MLQAVIDMCDNGHKFAKLSDHPTKDRYHNNKTFGRPCAQFD